MFTAVMANVISLWKQLAFVEAGKRMGIVELLVGVVVLCIGVGMSMTTSALTSGEFWVARICFLIAACALIGAYFFWLDASRSTSSRVVLGIIVGLLVIPGTTEGIFWVNKREVAIELRGSTAAVPNKTSIEEIKETYYLDVSLTPQPGYSSASLKAGQEITRETMRDRKQYLLILANKTRSTFDAVELRLQLPYPIDEREILPTKDTGNVRFDPAGPVINVEGGSTKVLRTPLTSTYELRIESMRPGGQAQILFILNSWRDPRGKSIPPEEKTRYRIPEWGPQITYINGYFLVHGIREPYYAPFDLSETGIVRLEKPRERPNELQQSINFQ